MSRSFYISLTAHALLIGWALLAGVFRSAPPPMEVTEVSVLSEAEFAALTAPSQPPESTQDVAAPPAPEPEPEPEPLPSPAVPDPEPAPSPQPPEPIAPPEPQPEAPPEPVAPPAPPEEPVTEAPPVLEPPPVPDIAAPETAPRPVPRPAPRVAPEPVAPPEPDTTVAEEVQEATTPDPQAAEVAEPVEEDTAPEAAATEIVTEAEEPARAAPAASLRPRTRPSRSAPTETAEAPADTADAVADAVAAALSGGTTTPRADVPEGPPMTRGEREALRLAVQACWVVDVGSQAANVTVTVAMQMERDGRVVPGSLTMIEAEGGTGAAVQTAFQAARRAILRCQRDGYDLPEDKYAQWREIEMVFNPSEMRLR
ncbi:cell envelope biogenesis protein TolA [Aestuariicoccus sp. MJ-SS9]|uniref:cell envelope biogenesis protein TolA n=1 Tax=Aestuariicoccus sp. MJ-SS9 TaxID=3079855 RepID=UPI0029081430|nr:cell envelope biogenesis protein TolA [Aestuariicoccus sp. MJ-SS9]MDU8910421.1 cell envelope biogenesis protein TolA [Aestuariicoccus sp. MJ-SS9]